MVSCISQFLFRYPIEPFVPYFVRLVATICDSTTLVYNKTVYTQEGDKNQYLKAIIIL